MKIIELSVTESQHGLRLDKAIPLLYPDLSRNAVQQLIDNGSVLINGKSVNKKASVSQGDFIEVTIPEPKELSLEPENIPLDIVYEDEHLLVVNKPKGMVVHPAAGNYNGTLVNALLYYCGDSLSGINGVIRPGIVHRIDKDTSGLLVVAKTDAAHKGLAEQIKEHSFTRVYNTVVIGNIKDDFGTIDAPIGRHPKDRKKQAVTDKNSRNAITHFEVLERYKGFTFLKIKLETGRTHQIRVHMASINHPLLGDEVYGPKSKPFKSNGQFLHAGTLGFNHPITNEYIEFTSELPDYFKDALDKLRK